MKKINKKHFISVVMPCLNEEDAVGICVKQVIDTFKKNKFSGEIIVADNGSTDNSASMAKKAGAKVIFEKRPGYGSAYLAGLSKARGDVIIMGDSDGTYDFRQIPNFLKKIDKGYDFVNGSRLKGNIAPGAFRFSHRYLAVPFLTGMLNILFGIKFSDAHCGMRAFTKDAYRKMNLRCLGMEFASEMIIKASSSDLKSTEIPINYFARIGSSKLVRFRDAWRHIRFMLLYASTYLYIIPGILFLLFGWGLLILMLPAPFYLFGHGFDIHAMMFVSTMAILGMNILVLGLFAKIFALYGNMGLVKNKGLKLFIENFNQERWIIIGGILFLIGMLVTLYVCFLWIRANFGPIYEVRAVILSTTMMVTGSQIIFASFFASLMIDRHKELL